MTDPERFSKNPPSQLSRLLLRVGAEEKPSAAALRRTASAVGAAVAAGAAVKSASAATTVAGVKLAAKGAVPVLAASATATTGGTAVPTGATLGAAVIAKWFGMGLLGGAIALPLARAVTPPPATKHAQPLAAAAVTTPASEPSRRAAREAEGRIAPEVAPSDNPNEQRAPSTVEARRAPISVPPPGELEKPEALARADSPLLAAEVRFVDQGRAALQRGDFNEALELLAPYENRFGQQQLLTEVLYLRMEAFSRTGDATRARSLAARLVTRGVAGPQAARARELLGR